MNQLPDIIVIEFCEWLKKQCYCSDAELLELTLDEDKRRELNDYINQYVRTMHPHNVNSNQLMNTFEYDADRVRRIIQKGAIRHSSTNDFFSDSNTVNYLMWPIEDLPMPVEIDFLEWAFKGHDSIDFRRMPLAVFENLVDRFIVECNKDSHDRKKLIAAYRHANRSNWINILETAASPLHLGKTGKLWEIIDRYQNREIPYKCFILQKKSDSEEYKELIQRYWEDLHHLSGDYLDIYYDTKYGASGFKIAEQMSYIPDRLKKSVPIIVLWENDLSLAQGIDIRQLNNEEIFEVIRCIVKGIKENKSFDCIVKEANSMGDQMRENQRPVEFTGVKITGGEIRGVIMGTNTGEATISYTSEEKNGLSDKELLDSFDAAEQIIRSFEKLDDIQKELVIESLNAAKETIKKQSDKKEEENSKKKFRNTIALLGSVGKDLIAALSGLTDILKFFGLGTT